MNNNFSLQRFALLFKKHTLEHGKTYLLSTAVLSGLLFAALGFVCYTSRGNLVPDVQGVIFVIFLLFAGSIFSSLTFADLGDKKKAIPVLTLPASHLEKYLVSFIYTFFIFLLVYLGVFYLMDSIVLSLSTPQSGKTQFVNVFSGPDEYYFGFVAFTLFHALTFCGAIWFEKMHFIKTAFLFFVSVLVLTLINQPILRMLIGREIRKTGPFENLSFTDNGRYISLEPSFNHELFGFAVVAVFTLMLWSCAYFRLKEKEV